MGSFADSASLKSDSDIVNKMGGKSSKNSLSEEDLSFLVKSASMPEKELKEWHKGFQKDCPTGELSKEKFISMYNSMFPNGNPEKFSENVFRTFDTNKNGTIDFREFMLALHITSNGTSEEKLAWAFRMYDIDGNGSVDFAEMKRYKKKIKMYTIPFYLQLQHDRILNS